MTSDAELCEQCQFYEVAQRKLMAYPDGQMYVRTGKCKRKDGPLFGRDLTGTFSAVLNASHLRLRLTRDPACFQQREEK